MVISTTIIPTVKTRKEFELQIPKEWRVAYDGVQFVLSIIKVPSGERP